MSVDLQDEKCELALKSGAEYAFNSAKDPKFIEKIIEVTGGGVHAVVNTSVHPSALLNKVWICFVAVAVKY